MSVPLGQRQEIEQRMQRRFQVKINLIEKEHKTEVREIRDRRHQEALEEAGIAAAVKQREEAREQIKKWEKKAEVAEKAILTAIPKINGYGSYSGMVDDSLKAFYAEKVGAAIQADLDQSDWGKQLNSLRTQMADLGDKIMLATSEKSIAEFWAKAMGVLDEKPQGLEAEALEIGKQNSPKV